MNREDLQTNLDKIQDEYMQSRCRSHVEPDCYKCFKVVIWMIGITLTVCLILMGLN